MSSDIDDVCKFKTRYYCYTNLAYIFSVVLFVFVLLS